MASGLLLCDLHTGDDVKAPWRALVIILFAAGEGAQQASTFARHWQPIVPEASFVGIELSGGARRPNAAALRRVIATAAATRSMEWPQMILLGAGDAGRLAVDMVVQGAIPGMGVIGLDISMEPAPSRIARTAARVRLVQHRAGEHVPPAFLALVDAMQQQDIDVRARMLPDIARAESPVTLRAAGAFLVELVANASCLPLAMRR